MRYFRRLCGPRVYLSPLHVDDYALYAKWLNDPEILIPLGGGPLISLESEKEYLEKMAKDPYNFAIVRKEDDQLLGSASLRGVDPFHRRATCGLFIGERENLGKGYGSEALALLVAYGFDEVNLNNINLDVADFNQWAFRAYEKVGFRVVGRRRKAWFALGQYYDMISMDILPEDLNRGLIATPERKEKP